MGLEEGMYVRTKQGTIEKVIKRYVAPLGYKVEVNEDFGFKHYEHNYIKYIKNASHNLIDLIELGDYVNGLPVTRICIDEETNKKYLNMYGSISEWENEDIKYIVTKEQFNSMKYVIGEQE